MKNIEMIETYKLSHHPENPRQDLGDLTELAESIRKNGIMQNLTVVFEDGFDDYDNPEAHRYWVVIGNRRMEAAKMAGLEAVPCVVSNMDHRTQIATMLEENMQRADLSLYEQAQGFQMMLDLGFTKTEISEKTGFSETTVSRRLKMAELNRHNLKTAVGKQITMEDLDRLGQVEDIKKRNELLAMYGENNFEWMVNAAIKKQKADKVRPKAMKMIKESKIRPIPEKDKYSLYGKYESKTGWRIELDKWDGKSEIIPKADGDLYYRENGNDIEFYQKVKKQKAEPVKKTPEEIEKEKRVDLAWRTVERVQKTAREMRLEFAKKMKITPTNAMEMLQWALIAATVMTMGYNTPDKALRKMAGLENEYSIPNRERELFKYIHSLPLYRWTELIFLMFEGEEGQSGGYAYGSKVEVPKWQDCPRVNFCYQWLRQFGYRMSDEEEQMQTGTLDCFREGTAE